MRRMRVCIYGGTDLQGTPTGFISALAYHILDSLPAVIVTGGFRHSNARPQAISTDVAALEGAQKYALEHGEQVKDCYEAWVPEPRLDDRRDVKGAVRLGEGDRITVRVMKGRTPLGRRLAMVAGVDMVITISGKTHTEIVVEQALELGVPVLPIPDAGGDSKDLLERYRERIATAFEPGALDQCLSEISRWIATRPDEAARAAVALIRKAKVGRCLVLLPYDAEHDDLYANTIRPSVEKHMVAVRLDRLPRSEAIYTAFADSIRASTAVIADITVLNENVMYEVGYAHGQGLSPLIYTTEPSRLDDLPVYLRTLNVRLISAEMPLESVIEEYLTSFEPANKVRRRAV